MAALLAVATMACAWAAPGAGGAREPQSSQDGKAAGTAPGPASVTVAVVPRGTEPSALAQVPGVSVGVLSAGLSTVSAAQTWLDIGQGNRVFTSLYDRELPLFVSIGDRVPQWGSVLERAESPPAEIAPGLLGSELAEAGVPLRADSLLVLPALATADREGAVARTAPYECLERRCPGVAILPATLSQLSGLVARLRGDDLLIAIERPPPEKRHALAIGIAGAGFDGNLSSDTTRTEGFVLATDLAPTILERLGLEIPEQMSGQPIRAEGDDDAGAVEDRAERMEVIAGRRGPVIIDNLLLWALAALIVAVASRGRKAPLALALLGLAVAYVPLVLLAGAALELSEAGEKLLVGLGAPALAALTLLPARGWAALALACGVSVAAYAIDMVAGSPLTALSLLGPNPGLGVRFFGIGNELEAALAMMVPIGVGAGLAAVAERRGPPSTRTALIAFLGAGGLAAVIFAAGRFGADVGAAIVFPAGAAAAALALPGVSGRRRLLLALIAAPVAGLAGLALIDLVLGGDAHLSRSVFEAGGADELANVFERRLRLSASSFNSATGLPIFWFALAAIALAIAFRRRILVVLGRVPPARAGFVGAVAAVLIGVLANDSGALFLTIGAIGLLGGLAFALSQDESVRRRTDEPRG